MNELPAEQTWLVLVELLTDLRKKEMEIPKEITKNIQMAKTTINFYKVDPTDPQRQVEVKRINEFLTSIQDALMGLAEKKSILKRKLSLNSWLAHPQDFQWSE
jgi:hypothetical protein